MASDSSQGRQRWACTPTSGSACARAAIDHGARARDDRGNGEALGVADDVEFTAGGATQEVSSVGGEGAIGQVALNADVRLLGYCASARLGVQLEVRDGC